LAVPPATNEAFLREVDEELRRDQALALWRRYGIAAAVALVVALLALAGYLTWRHFREQAAEAEAVKLQDAFDAWSRNQLPAASKNFGALAGSDTQGYRVSAIFSQGDLLLAKGDLKGAAAKFAQVANDASVEQPFRDLALIRQTTAEYDTLKPEVVVQRLKGLATPGNPWFGSAGELVAVAYIRQGKSDLAGKVFGQIARDEDAPESIRGRAVQMAGVLGVDAVPADVKAK
jgi:hypothetical protein